MTRAAAPVGGKREAGANVIPRQVGKVVQNFLLRHARREIVQYIVHSDSHPADAGFPTAFARFD